MDFVAGLLGHIGGPLLDLVISIAIIPVTAMIIGVLKGFLTKHGIEINQKQEDQLRELVKDSILAVEEAARRETKEGKEVKPGTKAMAAETMVLETNPEADLGKVRRLIDAELPKMRTIMTGGGNPMTRRRRTRRG